MRERITTDGVNVVLKLLLRLFIFVVCLVTHAQGTPLSPLLANPLTSTCASTTRFPTPSPSLEPSRSPSAEPTNEPTPHPSGISLVSRSLSNTGSLSLCFSPSFSLFCLSFLRVSGYTWEPTVEPTLSINFLSSPRASRLAPRASLIAHSLSSATDTRALLFSLL